MADLCEVRVVTHRRPEWLRHALHSLVGQTHPHWIGLVFDDSPDREAEAVVRSFGDDRLQYHPNPTNLGVTGNLNRAFRSAAYAGGEYACVLEDDNWFLPGWLAENVAALRTTGCAVAHRNQVIWDRFNDPPTPTTGTTLGRWYAAGVMTPMQLHAYMFLFPGVSNGALFWRTDCKSDLQVHESVRDASLQEYARCRQIIEPSAYLPEPQAVWADVPKNLSRRPAVGIRQFGRFLQFLRRGLVWAYGPEVVREAERIADRTGRRTSLERNLFNSLIRPAERRAIGPVEAAGYALRGAGKYWFVRNACPGYRPPPTGRGVA